MDGNTPLLNAEIEALAKIIAKQSHALQLKADFDSAFIVERLRIKNEGLKERRIRRLIDCPKLSEI